MVRKSWIYLVIFFILAINVNAFLISPPKIEVQFQPGLTQESTITLFNNRREDINLETYVKYDYLTPEALQALDNSIVLNESIISFTAPDVSKSFTATITLPNSIPEGLHDIRIGAVEEAVVGVVGSRSANEVRFLVLYGVEHQSTTSAKRIVDEGENPPEKPISEGSQQSPSASAQESSLNQLFTVEVVTTFIVEFLFLILLILFYLLLRKRKEALSIISLDADYKKESENVKIEAIIRNKSFDIIDDIYLDLQIIGKDANIIKTINVGPIKLRPASEGIITRIWDTKGVKYGNYVARALLYYHKNALIKQKQFSIL
jgi:preprotein translocase subunit SecG